MEPQKYLILNPANGFYKPEGKGYTRVIAEAGLWELEPAREMANYEYKMRHGLHDALILPEPVFAREGRLTGEQVAS